MKCNIFAGSPAATFPETSDIKNVFNICVDGGCVFAEKFGFKPDLVIGDFDTYKGSLDKFTECKKYKSEKDETDTYLAAKEAIKRNFDEIYIFGGLGGRFDHTFANLQVLKYIFDNGAKGYLIDACNIITMQKSDMAIYKKIYKYFSLFAFESEVKGLTIKGTKYTAENLTITNSFPIGISNEITEDTAEVSKVSGNLLVCFSKD